MSTNGQIPQVPCLRTELPGPEARKLIESDERYLSPSCTRLYPLAVKRGLGAMIEDVDGNVFLDFTAGIAVCSTGHCHPRVVKAIGRQSERLLHMCGSDFYYEPQRDLAQKLAQITPGDSPKRVCFTNSGTEAVEAAFKLARYHTGRMHMISFFGAFHGRSLGALSLTGSKVTQRKGFEPLIPEVSHVEFGNCYRCPINLEYGSCGIECVHNIEKTLLQRTVSAEEVAAIIVEPIQGEGGYVVPPPEYHRELKALAEKHGILYIADEIQTGMGRTGKMFALEHWGVEPDIICLAKGLGSGMPIGAMIASEKVMNWKPGAHGSTFGGNPVSCTAALETIRLLEEELIDNSAKVGEFLLSRLLKLKDRHPLIGDVRGLGLMIGAELVQDQGTKQLATAECQTVIQRCFQKGLLLLPSGESTIRFCPPLIITKEQVEVALGILEEALGEIDP